MTGMEIMVKTLLSAMGIKPEELIEQFKEPVIKISGSITSIDQRITRIETMVEKLCEQVGVDIPPKVGEVITIDVPSLNIKAA